MTNKNKGFTMIELLVVIAVIGVLAVAVLSAINPIEQINKGRDTGRRSDSGELINAIERYYASLQFYPWDDSSIAIPTEQDFVPANELANPADVTVLAQLISTNEIKTQLQSRINGYNDADQLQVWFPGGNQGNVYVCFLPRSTSMLTEAQTRCLAGAGAWPPAALSGAELTDSACPAASCTDEDNSGCRICLP